jgi:hypothetical protein
MCNLEWWVAVFDGNLFQDKHTTNSNVVLRQFAAELLLQNSPPLQSAINCLLSSAHIAHCFLVYILDVIIWSQNLPFVAVIRNNLLTNRKHAFKGTIVGNNLASSDTNSYFISQAGTFELV